MSGHAAIVGGQVGVFNSNSEYGIPIIQYGSQLQGTDGVKGRLQCAAAHWSQSGVSQVLPIVRVQDIQAECRWYPGTEQHIRPQWKFTQVTCHRSNCHTQWTQIELRQCSHAASTQISGVNK